MTENSNIQFSEQQIAALNARDIERYLQRIDDSYVQESEILPGPVQGPEGARQMLAMVFTAFPDLRFEIEQILASGDQVISQVRLTGTHRGSLLGIAATNKSVRFRTCNVVEVRNGKAIRSKLYSDNISLFQLGVLALPKGTAAG